MTPRAGTLTAVESCPCLEQAFGQPPHLFPWSLHLLCLQSSHLYLIGNSSKSKSSILLSYLGPWVTSQYHISEGYHLVFLMVTPPAHILFTWIPRSQMLYVWHFEFSALSFTPLFQSNQHIDLHIGIYFANFFQPITSFAYQLHLLSIPFMYLLDHPFSLKFYIRAKLKRSKDMETKKSSSVLSNTR